MKTIITINPEFQHLEKFINNIPMNFETQGEIIQKKRNTIKSIEVDGVKLNIKLFRKPMFFNRFIYSFFRKPKAYKAYYNAIEVKKRGFHTPESIALIEQKESNLLSYSYYISTQLENVKEIREYYFTKAENEDKDLLKAFAIYTAKLHNAGVLHLDYSPGNILISENNDEYQFSLVDINRMQFKKINIREGCENFSRLFESDEALVYIAPIYAQYRNLDANMCTYLMIEYKSRFEEQKESKKQLKRFFRIK